MSETAEIDGALCQLTPELRKAARTELFAALAVVAVDTETQAAEAAQAALFSATAARLSVSNAELVSDRYPLVVTGVVRGRAFHLRDRSGACRVVIAADDTPLDDPWRTPIETTTVQVASGDSASIEDASGDLTSSAALEHAVDAVVVFLERRSCEHIAAAGVVYRYCPLCGVRLAEAASWRIAAVSSHTKVT